MKIAVIAGTKVDTRMGVEFLESKGFKVLAYPMAETPREQTNLQYFSKKDLEELFEKNVLEVREAGAKRIFLYCNSLSSAIDYEKIQDKLKVPIITPLETYKSLPAEVKNIAILAANGISAYKIDQIITQYNPEVNTISIGNLSIVEAIEEGFEPAKIIKALNLDGLIKYLENIEAPGYKIDSLLLGCTHFPYIKEELGKATKLKIIDPTEDMINKLE